MARWASCLVGNLQFPTAVDYIGLEIVEGLDFRVAGPVTQVRLCDIPKSVTFDHDMDAICLRNLFRIDGNTVIGENECARILVRCRLCILQNTLCTNLRLAVLPGLTHTIIPRGQFFGVFDDSVTVIVGLTVGCPLCLDSFALVSGTLVLG